MLNLYRHDRVAIQTVFSADDRLSADAVNAHQLPVYVGLHSGPGDAVWVRPSDWEAKERVPDADAVLSRLVPQLDNVVSPLATSTSEGHLKPIVSWDGKVTMQPWDHSLRHVVGDVVHDRFSNAWAAVTG